MKYLSIFLIPKRSFFAIVLILVFVSPLYGLKVDTHKILNRYISFNPLNGFDLDKYLKEKLNFQEGVYEIFEYEDKSQNIYRWLQEGGVKEDDPFAQPWKPEIVPSGTRWINHFHNPLEPDLDKAGYLTGNSAIKWTFKPEGEQGWITGDYSWYDVRNYFYTALTSTDEPTREENFAKMFRGLGQLMHMVQDMSVPEHTRDDGHISSSYEVWLNNEKNMFQSGDAIMLKNCFDLNGVVRLPVNYFNSAYLEQASTFTDIMIPAANLFDNNKYTGSNPDDTSRDTNIFGLSEYACANFLTPNTIFWNSFDYPVISFSENGIDPGPGSSLCILDPVNITDPYDGKTEKYYSKCHHGEEIDFFLKKTLTSNYIDPASMYTSGDYSTDEPYWLSLIRDDRIYANYAKLLIPRAVGYSSQLLEYFFREDLEISLPEDGFYAKTNQENPDAGFDTVKVCVHNISYADMTAGTLDLVVQYKLSPCDPFTNSSIFNSSCSTRDLPFEYITAHLPENITIPKHPAPPLEIEFGLSEPIPLWATDVHICLVYRGTIAWNNDRGEIAGQESDTVAVGFKDISEPMPIHIFNNMDKICLDTISPENVRNKDWHDAGAEAIVQVDTRSIDKYGDNDGKGDEFDVYAHNIKDLYIRFSPIDRTHTVGIQPGEYHYKFQNIAPNTLLTQMYLLSDAQIEFIDLVNNKFKILPALQMSVVYSLDVFDNPDDTADDILKQDHDLFWSHYTIEDKIRYKMTWEYYPQALINQYSFDPNGVYSRFVPQFESFRGHELWAGTKVINPPYHPGISCDINNPVSHCPIHALNQ